MAFDITSVLKGVSGSDTGREQILYIALDDLDPDPDNFYSLDGLDDLAANIELIGLQQPLRVRPGEGGHYVVVSGHRRRAACLLIRDGDGDHKDMFSAGVPCIVDYDSCSEAMRKLRLIYANSSTRVLSSAEQSRQAEDVTALLYQLKEEGIEFPGRMRDHVAEACRISRSKLARLHAIRNNLLPELLERYDRGEIPEETAYQLSRLPMQAQAGVETCLMTGRKKQLPYSAAVERIVRDLDVYTKPASCRSHAGGPDCMITNVHICRSLWEPYRDCKNLTGANNKGICCRDCNDSDHCSWACQECKDSRKLDAAAEKEKEAARAKEEKARKEIQQKQFRKQRQEQAQRIRRLTDELGLIDECPLPPDYSWKPGLTVKNIERWAEGDFGDEYFYDADIVPTQVKSLREWMELLECSADYLLGLTDDPTPAAERGPVSGSDTNLPTPAGWSTGDPMEIGDYVVVAGHPLTEMAGCTVRTIRHWDGTEFVDEKTNVRLDLRVYRWVQLPED